jgi:hypothetical protein
MAPTINTTKLVATAIATFVSTDKFIIFPSIMAATPMTPFFERFEFQRAHGCRKQVRRQKEESSEWDERDRR